MESTKDKAAIVGIGYTPQGKIPGRTSLSFHLEAAKNAIADAGLKIEEVDGLLMQPAMGDPTVIAPLVAQHLGLRTHFLATHDVFGASAASQAHHAAWAVIHGLANYVLCTYGEKRQVW
jgi:acetyl-CoA acetyltransferase